MYRKALHSIKFSLLVATALFLVSHNTALAETKIFEKEYTYRASEADSKISSRAIALEQVKKLLLEELGVYLEAGIEVQNFRITKDQITTLAAGIVEIQVLHERWDGREYFIKARLTVDPAEVYKSIDALRKDRDKTKELEEVRRKSEALLIEREKLKKELMAIKGEVKQEKMNPSPKNTINTQRETIKALSAAEWFEQGYAHQVSRNYTAAIDAYNQAILADPQFEKAYKNRGSAYIQTGDYYNAVKDFNKAVELEPKSAETYYNRGTAYDNLGYYRQAISDFDKTIELNPGFAFAYFNRGVAYHNLKNFKQAVSDYKSAARLGHKQAQDFLRSNKMTW